MWVGRRLQLDGRSFEVQSAVLEHDERGFSRRVRFSFDDRELAILGHSFVGRDIEGVLKLMGHQNRGDVLHISQLDDFCVYRLGRNRIEAGGRLIEEQQPGPCGHRTRNRDPPTLSA